MENDLENKALNQEETNSGAEVTNDGPTVINTEIGIKNGQYKCSSCGSTDISFNIEKGKLVCNFCKSEFEPEKNNEPDTDIGQIRGTIIGSSAQTIVEDTHDIITLKCSSCGAEVVINTANATQARCHWCRNHLSINEQVPNGAVPDMILPFKVSKEEAKEAIEKFAKERKVYTNLHFKNEFDINNIMGVYLPYVVVDVNLHVELEGVGKYESSDMTIASYNILRDFDLEIDDLTVESNSNYFYNNLNKEKIDNNPYNRMEYNDSNSIFYNRERKTYNIINSIMPFDTENCVKWNANYIKGYSTEKRNFNIEKIEPFIEKQAKNIAIETANNLSKRYNARSYLEQSKLHNKG